MNFKKIVLIIPFIMSLSLFSLKVFSQDPDFYIFLCFGQSNMEGKGTIEPQDKQVDSRFKVMEAINCPNLSRSKGNWYTAVPPLTRCNTGLSPVDYFGRTMVANLPENIKIGIINVSVAGCKIELYDKDNYLTYSSNVESWMKNIINEYGGNPYGRLVELAQLAKKDGVIKGILLHQGESNVGDSQWPAKVKKIYENLITDLSLNPDSIPLLAGEVVNADQGGICAGANTMIAKLPQIIPNSHVISSKGCTDETDNLHFNSAGYREFGKRYGEKMLSILGYEVSEPEEPEEPSDKGTESFYFEPECASIGDDWEIKPDSKASNGSYIIVKSGTQSLAESAGEEGKITIPFTTSKDSTYYVFGRLNCPTADDDSYWVSMDNGSFSMCNGLATSGWQWLTLNNYVLTTGNHTLTITYREDGAKMDKICISNYSVAPLEKGDEAENICVPDTSTLSNGLNENQNGYLLEQNYPNPASRAASISFYIPNDTYVSLKVYNILGVEIKELAGKNYSRGKHNLLFETNYLSDGLYFYSLKADNFTSSKKFIIKTE